MIYLLIGPSGSGKSTLGSCLRDMNIPELKSHTTRKPRPGEMPAENGGTYYFINTLEQFAAIPLVESTEYAGNYYGTSIAEVSRVLTSGGSAFAIVDRHGIEAFKSIYGDLVKVIYIYASPETVLNRMIERGDKLKDACDRVDHAERTGEFKNMDIADYCIINKDLDASIRQLAAIVRD